MDDCESLLCFVLQVNCYGKARHVFLSISTSDSSKKVLFVATVAKVKEMKVVGLTGTKDSKLSAMEDVWIQVPDKETHLPVCYCLCLVVRDSFFGNE